jgi:hypothetical protein
MASTKTDLLVNPTPRKINIKKPTRSSGEEAEYQIPNSGVTRTSLR